MALSNTDLKQVPKEWNEFLGILKSNNASLVLEVGTFRGMGTVGLCKVAEKVITIDLDDRRIGRPRNSKFIKGSSHDNNTLERVIGAIGDGNELDALFIDADHSYEGVKKDFELYSRLVKHNGIIGLHDIVDSDYHRRKDCHVCDFWNEIKGNYSKHAEMIYDGRWAGIGVVWNILAGE